MAQASPTTGAYPYQTLPDTPRGEDYANDGRVERNYCAFGIKGAILWARSPEIPSLNDLPEHPVLRKAPMVRDPELLDSLL